MGEFGDGLELEKQRTPLNFLQESWIFGCAKPSTLGEFLEVLEMVFLQKKSYRDLSYIPKEEAM